MVLDHKKKSDELNTSGFFYFILGDYQLIRHKKKATSFKK
jgi:hypothetical protein